LRQRRGDDVLCARGDLLRSGRGPVLLRARLFLLRRTGQSDLLRGAPRIGRLRHGRRDLSLPRHLLRHWAGHDLLRPWSGLLWAEQRAVLLCARVRLLRRRVLRARRHLLRRHELLPVWLL
jgi:hypothetical protein